MCVCLCLVRHLARRCGAAAGDAAVVLSHLYISLYRVRFNVVQLRGAMSGGTTVEIKYLTQPHDGTPGKPWEDFEERLLDVAAGKTDSRGYSLANCLN